MDQNRIDENSEETNQTQVEETTISEAASAEENSDRIDDPKSIELSTEFIGRWSTLISTTNWEKGKIISEWREALQGSHAPAAAYSDEAWCRRVGGITPQHVGRLRRVHDRFHDSYESFAGLYWSHFLAAMEWDDAEMWLEGAVQSKWSVSGMRKQRWETLGKVGQEPNDADVVATELTEETQSLSLSENPRNNDRDYIEGPVHEGPDWGDEDSPSNGSNAGREKSPADGAVATLDQPDESIQPHAIRPFESFDNLPDDVMDAANAFKIAIIKHKATGWEEVSLEDLLGMLDALKQLATIAAE